MYKIVNKTSRDLLFKGIIVPNQEVLRDENDFYQDVFGSKELRVSQIYNEYGNYTSYCKGNIYRIPKSGKEGTIFGIFEY